DEPTPKLTETGGLSLISLKHVASRGPAGLPQARSARRISQRRSRAALRKGPFPETRDRPRQRHDAQPLRPRRRVVRRQCRRCTALSAATPEALNIDLMRDDMPLLNEAGAAGVRAPQS